MNVQEYLRTARTGQLSVDEIGRGMHKSFKNACALIDDAELLLASSPGRSLSLAVLAIEEIAKIVSLASVAARAARSPISWKKAQKKSKLFSHEYKQAVFANYGKRILDKSASERGKDTYYENIVPADICPLLDFFKQLGFYVDVVQGKFTSPEEFGSENSEWAEWLIAVARERLESFEKLHGTEDKSLYFARKVAELSEADLEAAGEEEHKAKIRELIEELRHDPPP